MNSYLRTIYIIITFIKCFGDKCVLEDKYKTELDNQDFGKVMTGPPSHGDYVFCFPEDFQIVLSGGLCKTIKQGYGKFVWGDANNNDIFVIYDKLLFFRDTVKCGSFYTQYYIVGFIGGCMISISDIRMIEEIKPMISSWTIFEENSNYVQTSSTSILEPSFGYFFGSTIICLVLLKMNFISNYIKNI